MLERLFDLKGHGTDVRTEVMAGLTTFMTMAYIVVVNVLILLPAFTAEGMGPDEVERLRFSLTTATCLAAALATLMMGVWANYPVGLAPGMGANAYFVMVVTLMGVAWSTALGAVFWAGAIFLALSLFRVRERIVNATDSAQLHQYIERLPTGYDTLVGERGLTLSGGQRQRLSIARSILLTPGIIVFDDSTASVDAATEQRIQAALREAMRGVLGGAVLDRPPDHKGGPATDMFELALSADLVSRILQVVRRARDRGAQTSGTRGRGLGGGGHGLPWDSSLGAHQGHALVAAVRAAAPELLGALRVRLTLTCSAPGPGARGRGGAGWCPCRS